MVNFSEDRMAQLAKSTLLTCTLRPPGYFKICAESNRKLSHLFNPSKTATLVPEFAVEDLPLHRIGTLILQSKTCSLAEHSDDDAVS